jgi:HD-like signal output (HDOD) protein
MNVNVPENIPVYPPVAAKLLQAASNPDARAEDLICLLEADPALSAEIIGYANSPAFRRTEEVRTVSQAAGVLGVEKLRSLALAAIGRGSVRALLMVDELGALWRYSMACALLSRMLARDCGVAEDVAYTCGLLHDIGRLSLMAASGSGYAALLQTASPKPESADDFDFVECERTLFGTDRFAAADSLARRWNLPEEYCAIASGKAPAEAGHGPDLAGVVGAACRLADSIGFGVSPAQRRPSYPDVVESLPGGAADRFPAREEDLRARVEEGIDALDLDMRPDGASTKGEMQALLRLEEAARPPLPDAESAPEPDRARRIWQVLLVLASVFAILLVVLRIVF